MCVSTATATYSGSTDGVYMPASVTVGFAIPPCQKADIHHEIVDHVISAIPLPSLKLPPLLLALHCSAYKIKATSHQRHWWKGLLLCMYIMS